MKKNKDKMRPACVNLYALKDIKQPRFFPPFTAPNDNLALRYFSIEVSREEGLVAASPEDFELWKLGDFDPIDGQIDRLDDPEYLAASVDILRPAPEPVEREFPLDQPNI